MKKILFILGLFALTQNCFAQKIHSKQNLDDQINKYAQDVTKFKRTMLLGYFSRSIDFSNLNAFNSTFPQIKNRINGLEIGLSTSKPQSKFLHELNYKVGFSNRKGVELISKPQSQLSVLEIGYLSHYYFLRFKKGTIGVFGGMSFSNQNLNFSINQTIIAKDVDFVDFLKEPAREINSKNINQLSIMASFGLSGCYNIALKKREGIIYEQERTLPINFRIGYMQHLLDSKWSNYNFNINQNLGNTSGFYMMAGIGFQTLIKKK